MDKNVGKSPDRVENADWQGRPKLDAKGVSDDFALASAGQAMSSSADDAKDEPGQAAGPVRNEILPRSLRLPMIAAALAAAAAFGSFAGSLTASGVTQLWPHVAPSSSSVAASEAQASNVELAALSALKTYVEGAARNANNQFATLADRLDRIERMQAEPNVKLARIVPLIADSTSLLSSGFST